MGNDQTTLRHKDVNLLDITKYSEVSAQHNRIIYEKSLKSFTKFSSILKSIHVRSDYLDYEWAKWLCTQLSKNPSKLYEKYCEALKLNVMKKSDSLQYFRLRSLDSKFMIAFQKKAKCLQSKNFNQSQLQKLFEQAKCYFMVSKWFEDLPLNDYMMGHQAIMRSKSKQNKNAKDERGFQDMKILCAQKVRSCDQKIYRLLLKLTEIFFDHNFLEQEHNNWQQCQSPKKNPMKRFNSHESSLIKMISRESSFIRRQYFVLLLLESILKWSSNAKQNTEITIVEHKMIYALTRVLGLRNVFCVLKVITEVGLISHIQKIQMVFNHILQTLVKPRLNNTNLSNQSQVLQRSSPTKWKQRSKKTTDFIR